MHRWSLLEGEQRWRAVCHNITGVDVELVHRIDDNKAMIPSNIVFANNSTNNFCCRDSNTFIKIFTRLNREHFNVAETNLAVSSCHFSDNVEGICNEGVFHQLRYCVSKSYVIMHYSKVFCYSHKTLKNVCDTQWTCLP
jgi:hypothetical protein